MDAVSVRPVPELQATPADVLRATGSRTGVVVLTGNWAGGGAIVAADPVRLESSWSPLQQRWGPPGTVGGGWFGWQDFHGAGVVGLFPNVLRHDGGQWWDEALPGIVAPQELQRRRQALRALAAGPPSTEKYELGPLTASRSRSEHCAAVERCVAHIRDGDIYQANICLQLRAGFDGSAASMHADVIESMQPSYGAFLALGGRTVASASPELFLRRAGRSVVSAPIKGTRPRDGPDPGAEADRLANSAKDRAENVMIVDLVRNDLARVAVAGSVRVPRLLEVVAHPGVWHLVSEVAATLRPGVTDAEVIAAAFPPGSVTGTPKLRAVQVIAELEDVPRGVYTGAIGYLSPVAGLELSVAIRTAEIADGQLAFGAGGGVTADSTPVQEWWECFDKARPFAAAVGTTIAEPDAARTTPDADLGLGVFDTSLVLDGRVVDASAHLARLERSLYELYQRPLPAEASLAYRGIRGDGRLRVDVLPDGSVSVQQSAVPAPVAMTAQGGLAAAVAVLPGGLGHHKLADRSRHRRLEQAWGPVVIVADADGGSLETTRGNVLAVVGDRLVTAPLDGRILPGVTRQQVLDLARDAGIEVELGVPTLLEVDGLAVAGSLTGLEWVRSCGGRTWPEPAPLLCELSTLLLSRWTLRDRRTRGACR